MNLREFASAEHMRIEPARQMRAPWLRQRSRCGSSGQLSMLCSGSAGEPLPGTRDRTQPTRFHGRHARGHQARLSAQL
jgi:hypothetical protein